MDIDLLEPKNSLGEDQYHRIGARYLCSFDYWYFRSAESYRYNERKAGTYRYQQIH